MSNKPGNRTFDQSGIIALRFIRKMVAERGYPPTRQEIADELELRSKGSTQPIIERLVERGLLVVAKRPDGQRADTRAITITEAGMKAITDELTA
jgi:SOS-response transcriptional repressor LexA